MGLSAQLVTIIILGTLVGGFLLNLVADALNIRHLQTVPPDEFKDLCNPEQYRKSQNYLKENTGFGLITAVFDLLVLLVFWFMKGFSYLDTIARSFELNPAFTGLIYIGLLLLLKLIIGIPFSLWSTFVIEERYGFNKTTIRTFLLDLVKTILLSALLGGVFLYAILSLLAHGGPFAWIWCWTAGTLFLFAVQYIVPTWIMPLFNRFTPLEEGPLRHALMTYARSIDFPLTHIFVMDGSKRSTKANAFFTGFGKNKRIVLFDTLIKDHDVDELVAVLAHEMGHFKKKHIMKRMLLSILQMGMIFWLMSICISFEGLFTAFYMEQPSIYAGLIFFGMLYTPVDLFLSMFMQILSRHDEFEADTFAATTSHKGEALITALKKLSVSNLSNLTPHPFYVFLHYSHPPVMDRIEAIRNT